MSTDSSGSSPCFLETCRLLFRASVCHLLEYMDTVFFQADAGSTYHIPILIKARITIKKNREQKQIVLWRLCSLCKCSLVQTHLKCYFMSFLKPLLLTQAGGNYYSRFIFKTSSKPIVFYFKIFQKKVQTLESKMLLIVFFLKFI